MSLRDDFFDLIDSLLGPVPLIDAEQNGKRLKRPFATLKVSPGAPAPVHHGQTDEDGYRCIYAQRIVEVQIQAYGAGAWDVMDALAMRLMTETAQDASEAANIGILSIDRLQSVPALLEGMEYEERAILDLTANYVAAVTEEVGVIESVQGEGLVGDGLPAVPFAAP